MYGRDPYAFNDSSFMPRPLVRLIINLLKSWDQAKTDYKYIDAFFHHGILHVTPEPAVGEAAMRKLHDDMIHPTRGPIVALQHYLDRIFFAPTPADGKMEAMFTGKLTSVLKSGDEVTTDFATWVVSCADARGEYKIELLRVFSDTSELTKKIGEMLAAPKSEGEEAGGE